MEANWRPGEWGKRRDTEGGRKRNFTLTTGSVKKEYFTQLGATYSMLR
jgi:hypothetical protein